MKQAIWMVCASAIAITLATPALAQSDASATPTDEIIVTAQRRAERTQDVPISITALSGDTLEQANVQQLGDIAKLSPATRFDYQANFVQPTIRGVGTAVVTSGGGSNVGIYVDGFYSPNPLAGDFQLLSVDGIQVLKGPQGTLFGRNTTGGAILVTTTKPGQDTHATFEASYGRFNTFRIQGYATGGLTDKLSADIEGNYARSDGYVRNIVPGPKHPGQFENWTVRAGLNFEASDTVSFLLRYTHQDVDDGTNVSAGTLKQDGVIYAPFQGLPEQLPAALVPTGYREAAINPNSVPGFEFKADIFQLTGTFDFDFATLASYTQYRKDDSIIRADQDQTAADINYNEIPVHDRTFSQELLLTSNPGGKLQWTAGLFYFYYTDEYFPLKVGTNALPSSIYINARSHSRTRSFAGFVDLTYQLTDKLFLTAGARYTHDNFDEAEFKLSVFGTPIINNVLPPLSGDRVTPRAVLRYALDDQSSVYASYTRGYKAALTDVISGSQVKPETMDAFELGFKHASGKFSFNLAGWYYDYKNLQVSVYERGLSQILNAATARIKGVEGDLRYQVTPDFEISASGAYVDARYRSFPNGSRFQMCVDATTCGSDYGQFILSPIDASGFRMQRAPEFTASLGAHYGFDLGGGRLTLSGNFYHTSKFYFDLAEQFYDDGYDLLGLRAEWTDASKRFTIAAYGDNVTGAKYYTQILAHSPSIGDVWGAPTTWGVSVRTKF
jgi:iron complex outermembrane receptor protein